MSLFREVAVVHVRATGSLNLPAIQGRHRLSSIQIKALNHTSFSNVKPLSLLYNANLSSLSVDLTLKPIILSDPFNVSHNRNYTTFMANQLHGSPKLYTNL